MTVSKVEVVVLGLLADEPMHGYDLLERFRTRSMEFWAEVGKASVYQALQRLEARGFVTGRAQEGTEGPDRRVYKVTRTGHDRLMAGLGERFVELEPYETRSGVALGFAHLLPAADVRKAVDARERAVKEFLDAIRDERTKAAGDRGAGRSVANAMLDRQETLAKAELGWIRGFRTALGRLRR